MCNLYSNTMPVSAMRSLFDVSQAHDHLGNAEPLKAIFPRYDAPICRLTPEGDRELVSAHWGFLMPQTSKTTGKPILPRAVNNARDDKLKSSRFWSASFKERRCIIPATAFCEAKGKKPATYVWFGVAGSGYAEPFGFAGLWRSFSGRYRDKEVEIETYTMVTSTPNDLVKEVHPDRMPVILKQSAFGTWLTGSPDEAFAVIETYPAEDMKILGSGEGLKSEPSEGP
jgi:putative SOS response-associated peptidase YedK